MTDGREVALPAGLPAEWTVVIVAFRREQQELADSWVPWLEQRAAADPRLGFVELPAIGLQWQPARPVIDGGMAAAIRDQETRRRTLTVYTDIRRVTVPLGISDRGTIWLFLVDRAGRVLSLADHGLTFGTTTTTRGVCLQLRDPVPGIDPTGLIRHLSLTLTVADPQRFTAAMRHRAGMASGHTAPAQDSE